MLLDKFNRTLDLLVIDPSGRPMTLLEGGPSASTRVMSTERLYTFVAVLARLGIDRIVLDHGEALARPDILKLLKRIGRLRAVASLVLTTDGRHLPRFLEELAPLRLARIDLLLPALDEESYRLMTGHDGLASALSGLRTALLFGAPVRLKAPLVGGMNHDQIAPLMALAAEERIDLLFTEAHAASSDPFVSVASLFADAAEAGGWEKRGEFLYRRGEEGPMTQLIPLAQRRCEACHNLWLSAEGKLHLCYGLDDTTVDVDAFFDEEPTEADLIAFISKTPLNKPLPPDASCVNLVRETD